MRIVYVAGPFRAATPWEIEQNVRKAEALALEVWQAGAAAICPHANTRFFHQSADDALWLAGDLEIIRRCDAVILVPGWRQSRGTTIEVDLALGLGLSVFESLDDLEKWLCDK